MPNITLSNARVKALRPRPSACDLRDAKLKGFGVRVYPSGARRFFIHTRHRGTRVWKLATPAPSPSMRRGFGPLRCSPPPGATPTRRCPWKRRASSSLVSSPTPGTCIKCLASDLEVA